MEKAGRLWRFAALGVAVILGATFAGPAVVAASPTPKATTLTISATPNPAWVGDSVTLTFSVSPKPDGGNVIWGGHPYPVDPSTGDAVTPLTTAGPGTYQVDAYFFGTDAYLASPSVSYDVVINQHAVAATMTLPGASVGRGDAFDIQVALDAAPTTGTILIQDMTSGDPGPTIASAAANGSSPVTVHVDGLEPGSYNLRANYAGAPAYAAAVTPTQALTVFDRPTVTRASIEPNPAKWGEAETLQMTVSPVPDDGIGGFTVTRDGSQLSPVTMNPATGTGSLVLPLTTPGDHSLTVVFHSNGRYASSSVTIPETVSTTPIDTDPPTGSVVINGGADIATDSYVVLTVTSSDPSGVSAELSCNQVDWVGIVPNGDQGASINSGEPGCLAGEGTKTLYVRLSDAYGNSTIVSDSIVLENQGPLGTIILADGTMVTITRDVTLNVAAEDEGSGLALVSLSNDQSAWTTRPYGPTQAWSLTSGDGEKVVFVKWRDGYGHWSDVRTLNVELDTTAPSASNLAWQLKPGVALSSGRPGVRLSWSGADVGSGIDHFQLSQQIDGGSWAAGTLNGSGVDRFLAPGHTYRFAIRAVDKAGNVGGWTYSSTFKLTAVSQSSSVVHYHGTWANSTSTTWWGGTAKSSSTKGSTVSYTFTGKSIAWVGLTASNRGKAAVYVNGVYKATVDLYSATSKKQLIVWSANYSTSATRTITIKVLGTSGRPRVDIDGFVVGR